MDMKMQNQQTVVKEKHSLYPLNIISNHRTDDLHPQNDNEPPRDKINNVAVHPAKTQISLGIRSVWSEP